MKGKTIKLLEENIGEYPPDLQVDEAFFKKNTESANHKEKKWINQTIFVKNFFFLRSLKETLFHHSLQVQQDGRLDPYNAT